MPITVSRIEALNQAVRAIVTLGLVGGFIFGFVVVQTISGEVYTAIVSGVVGFWFAARQGEQAAKAALEASQSKTNGVTVATVEVNAPKVEVTAPKDPEHP